MIIGTFPNPADMCPPRAFETALFSAPLAPIYLYGSPWFIWVFIQSHFLREAFLHHPIEAEVPPSMTLHRDTTLFIILIMLTVS